MANVSLIGAALEVSLFIPCLVDQLYPEIGVAMVQLLKHFGYGVKYNPALTCCGQPAFNGGHWDDARKVARVFINGMADAKLIVCPSGSCTAMIRNFYAELFKGEPEFEQVQELRQKTLEFSEFVLQENLLEKISGKFSGRVGFHNSCHSARELRIGAEPLEIISKIAGFELIEIPFETVCCGFGGIFSVKFPSIASGMAKTRLEMFTNRDVDTIVSNDPGCLMHLRREIKGRGLSLKTLHLTEFLAQSMGLSSERL